MPLLLLASQFMVLLLSQWAKGGGERDARELSHMLEVGGRSKAHELSWRLLLLRWDHRSGAMWRARVDVDLVKQPGLHFLH